MEKRCRLLREHLETDTRFARKPANQEARTSWTLLQRSEVELEVQCLDLTPQHSRTVVSCCLMQRHAVAKAFDSLLLLEQSDGRRALLKSIQHASLQAFDELFLTLKSVTTSERSSSSAHQALVYEMTSICQKLSARMDEQQLIAGVAAPSTTVRGRPVPVKKVHSEPDLAEARRKLQAACYGGRPNNPGGQLQKIFDRMDLDKSNTLGHKEFTVFVRKYLKLPPQKFSDSATHLLFRHIDSIGSSDGHITIEELEAFLKDSSVQPRTSAEGPTATRGRTSAMRDVASDGTSVNTSDLASNVPSDTARALHLGNTAEDDVFAIFDTLGAPAPNPDSYTQDGETSSQLDASSCQSLHDPIELPASTPEIPTASRTRSPSPSPRTSQREPEMGSTGDTVRMEDAPEFSEIDLDPCETEEPGPPVGASPSPNKKKKKKKDKKARKKEKEKDGGVAQAATSMLSNAFGNLWK